MISQYSLLLDQREELSNTLPQHYDSTFHQQQFSDKSTNFQLPQINANKMNVIQQNSFV